MPFRLRGILTSILALTRVILDVMRHRCARPSCITTAARSACFVGSQAVSVERKKIYRILHDWDVQIDKSVPKVKV